MTIVVVMVVMVIGRSFTMYNFLHPLFLCHNLVARFHVCQDALVVVV